MTDKQTQLLMELANLYGVEWGYHDVDGVYRQASKEALLCVLQSLGAPLKSLECDELENAVREKRLSIWSQLILPFNVAWDGWCHLLIRIPSYLDNRDFHWDILCDDDRIIRGRGSLEDLPLVESTEIDKKRYLAKRLSIAERLSPGYATLRFNFSGRAYRSKIAVTPQRAYYPIDEYPRSRIERNYRLSSALYAESERDNLGNKRRWGVFLPLYALKSNDHNKFADLGDLEDLISWTADRGGDFVGTLPILANFLDQPYQPSPYVPISRLFWNEVYLNLQYIPEWQACPGLHTLANDVHHQTIEQLRTTNSDPIWSKFEYNPDNSVDFKAEMAHKRHLLEIMLAHLEQNDSSRREDFEKFAANTKEAVRYSEFRAVMERRNQVWQEWPKTIRGGYLRKQSFDVQAQRYHLYVQWNLQQQLEKLSENARRSGLGLYLDLALGVHPNGYDTWRYQKLFADNMSTGAPPDPLFRGGQNWGFPPLNPLQMVEQAHEYMIDALKNHTRYAGILRIDHVMGLHRLFWIPDGMTANEGVYVRYPADDLHAILSLESHRTKTILIGEDLGTVPPVVWERMRQHRIQHMYVMPFAITQADGGKVLPPPANTVASLNTHDMPTYAAMWQGLDIAESKSLNLLSPEMSEREEINRQLTCQQLIKHLVKSGWLSKYPESIYPANSKDLPKILRASLQYLAASESRMLMLSLEDLWQEIRPQNIPGTCDEHRPNWRGRARFSLEQIDKNEDIAFLLAEISALRKQPSSSERIPAIHSLYPPTPSANKEQPRRQFELSTEQWGEMDDYFFVEGTHDRLYEKLGAHIEVVDGQYGVRFLVWGPNAAAISVVGDFNQWNPEANPMQKISHLGIWQTFVPGISQGEIYKYQVTAPHGGSEQKTDPYGFCNEEPPRTGSVVWSLNYQWQDEEWMRERKHKQKLDSPISIYEVHLGSWMRDPEQSERFLGYREIAPKLADYIEKMGYTHVELMPIMEHPFYGSWGYQSLGYFSPTRRYGHPQDLMAMIDILHQRGIGVILDWVPSHFPKDGHGISLFDGIATYEYPDPRKGYHPDWTSNIFDYGRGEVQSYLLSSALFWLEHLHADGLRIDGVASMLYLDYSRKEGEWIPNIYGGRENLEAVDFLRRFNEAIYRRFPDVQTFAEESTSWAKVSRPIYDGGLGFGLKWDMGWMHDTLTYMSRDSIHRKYHHNELTFRMLYAFHENFVLALSHDEVVHGKGSLLQKMPGDRWQQRANLRLLYGYMFGQPGKKLLFMGQDFGMDREWNHDISIDWHFTEYPEHRGIQLWVEHLNRIYKQIPALHQGDCVPGGFEWVVVDDTENSVLAWLRYPISYGPPILIVCNFTPIPRYNYRIGVPQNGFWREIANSDAMEYAGSGVGNGGGCNAEPIHFHQFEHSLNLTLPPLSAIFLQANNSR
jgi:alpha-1,4-glucan:alpha-1,4-glucan 6-glycosyltransferase/4-alpha-glucanotransferase